MRNSQKNKKPRRQPSRQEKKRTRANRLAHTAKGSSYCTLTGRLQPYREGETNAQVDNGKPIRLSLLPPDQEKLDFALFETFKAATLASGAFLNYFRILLASLPASLAYQDDNPLPLKPEALLLFSLWIVAENQTDQNSSFVIAKGTDDPEDRSQKVVADLKVILAEEGLSSTQIQEWLDTLGPTLSANIRPDAVFVNRRAMLKAALRVDGSSFTKEDALDLIEFYFKTFSAMVRLFKPEGAGNLDSSIPALTYTLFSNRFGIGEGADFQTLSSIYSTIYVWVSDLLETFSRDPADTAEDTTSSSLSGLLDHLFLEFPLLSQELEKDNKTKIEALLSFLSRNGHKSATRNFLAELATNTGPISEEDLQVLAKLSDKDFNHCSESIGKKGQRDYLNNIVAIVERICGVPFSPSGTIAGFYKNAISNACERLYSHLALVGIAETKRHVEAKEGAESLATCNKKAQDYLDQFCLQQKIITGCSGDYIISSREGYGYSKLHYLWVNKKCNTAEKKQELFGQQKSKLFKRSGSVNLFSQLCGTPSSSDDPMANFDPISDLPPNEFRAYIDGKKSLSKASSQMIPMLKHFDPILSQAQLRFGSGLMDVKHYAKEKHSAKDKNYLDNLHRIELKLWDLESFKKFTLFWESRRISSALALYSPESENTVPLATRLGLCSAGLAPDDHCKVAGLIELPNWPISIMADKESLIRVTKNSGSKTQSGPQGEVSENSGLNYSGIRWNVAFHIKTQASGPYPSWTLENIIKLDAQGMPKHPENGSSRGTAVQLQYCRLPEGLRILGVDLGIRHPLACSILVTCSKKTVDKACRRARRPTPEEDDPLCVIETYKKGRKKTDIYFRTGLDFLPNGTKNPSPWAKLESYFTLKLPGEFEGDKRELGDGEMLFLHKLETELGIPEPYIQRLIASGYGSWDDFPEQKKRLRGLLKKASLKPPSKGKGPLDSSLKKPSRDAITAYSDLLFTIKRVMDALFTLRKAYEFLLDSSQDNIANALELLWGLVDRANGIGAYAKKLWDRFVTGLPGYQNAFLSDTKTEHSFNSLAALLGKSSYLGRLKKSLGKELPKWERTIEKAINQLHGCLFPSEAPKTHRPRATFGNFANIHMGGLSLERIDTLGNFIFKLMRPFARYSATHIANTPISGKDPSSLKEIGLKELHKVQKLKKERQREMANLLLSAALGDYRDKFNPKGARQAPNFSQACHLIVIEDLSNFKPSQDRTRRENRIISKLKASGFKDTLEMGCQRYGIKLHQVWPAETSRIDARTGGFGIRVLELTALKFMTLSWVREMVREAEERQKNGGYNANDKLLISTNDKLKGLSASQLAKAPNVFIPSKGGPLFLSVSPSGTKVLVNADLNASLNIALRALMDPDLEGSHYKIVVDSEGNPVPDLYKGCSAISKGEKLKEEVLKEEDPEVKGEEESPEVKAKEGNHYLFRPLSWAPIDNTSSWLRIWVFYRKINEMGAKKLLEIMLARYSGAGFDP